MTRPDGDDQNDPQDGLSGRVTQSMTRIADSMPVDGGGVAFAAVREARAIRRRRSIGTVAAAAALVAVAVPVALRLGAPASAPVGPAVSSTLPDHPAAPSAEHTVTLPTSGAPSGRIVRPYAVDGTYHGASGTVRLAPGAGLTDVLNLDGGTKVLRAQSSSGGRRVLVQSPDGSVALTLPDGRAVADATGRRWALLDTATGGVTVRDSSGSALSSISSGSSPIRTVVGFSGERVLVTTAEGTSLADPTSHRLTQVSGDTALDASDTARRAVYSVPGGESCWQVRSTADQSAVAPPTCGEPGTVTLSADGRHVVVRSRSGAEVLVHLATGGRPVLLVSVPAGATIEDSSLRIGLDELVLATSDRDGHRLVGCTTKGVCEVLTATSPTPYLLVRD